jgi:hypothetical protein
MAVQQAPSLHVHLLAEKIFAAFVDAANDSDPCALSALRACRRVCKVWRAGVDEACADGLSRLAPRSADARLLASLSSLPFAASLTTLALARAAPPLSAMWALGALRGLGRLKTLDFSDCLWLTADALGVLGDASDALPCLTFLSLARCTGYGLEPGGSGGEGLAGLALRPLAPRLRVLDVSRSTFSPASLLLLAPALRDLRELRAAGALYHHPSEDNTRLLRFAINVLSSHGTLDTLILSHAPALFREPHDEEATQRVLARFAPALRFLDVSCSLSYGSEELLSVVLGEECAVSTSDDDDLVGYGNPRLLAPWAAVADGLEATFCSWAYNSDVSGSLGFAMLGERRGVVLLELPLCTVLPFQASVKFTKRLIALRLRRHWSSGAMHGRWEAAADVAVEALSVLDSGFGRGNDYAAAFQSMAARAFEDGADGGAPRRLVRLTNALLRRHVHFSCLMPGTSLGVTRAQAAAVALELVHDAEAMMLYCDMRSDNDADDDAPQADDSDEACLVREALERSEHDLLVGRSADEDYGPADLVCIAAPPGVLVKPHRWQEPSPPRCRVAFVDQEPAPRWLRAGALCRAWHRAEACSGCVRREERLAC